MNGTLVFGDLIITLGKMEAKSNFLMTTLLVQHKDVSRANRIATIIIQLEFLQKAVSREVVHFWFTSWPDHGVPEATIPVITFIREVRNHQKEIPGPILVHCRYS